MTLGAGTMSKNEDLYYVISWLHYESKKPTTQSWTENKYGLTLYINFHFSQFVNKAQTVTCSLLRSSHPWLGFPSKRQEVLAADPPPPQGAVTFSPSNHSVQSFRGEWKCQWLGTFLRNGFQPQVGTEFPEHINICYVRKRHCNEPGIYLCPKGWLSPGGNLHPEYPG